MWVVNDSGEKWEAHRGKGNKERPGKVNFSGGRKHARKKRKKKKRRRNHAGTDHLRLQTKFQLYWGEQAPEFGRWGVVWVFGWVCYGLVWGGGGGSVLVTYASRGSSRKRVLPNAHRRRKVFKRFWARETNQLFTHPNTPRGAREVNKNLSKCR